MHIKKYLKFLICLLIILKPLSASCQQTIINMPSSNVLPKGEVILKQSNKFNVLKDEYALFTPQVIIGTGCDTEISLEAGTKIKEERTSVDLNLTAKKVFKFENSTRFTIGGVISPSLTEGTKPNSMLYANTSYTIQKTKTHLAAGAYLSGKQEMPSLMGAMVGVEQVIIPDKLRLATDWVSRSESQGAFSVGLKYKTKTNYNIGTYVVMPNSDKGKTAFLITLSKNIGPILKSKKEEAI